MIHSFVIHWWLDSTEKLHLQFTTVNTRYAKSNQTLGTAEGDSTQVTSDVFFAVFHNLLVPLIFMHCRYKSIAAKSITLDTSHYMARNYLYISFSIH
jgi:hypothetical protein